jgi:hypothetical protein
VNECKPLAAGDIYYAEYKKVVEDDGSVEYQLVAGAYTRPHCGST